MAKASPLESLTPDRPLVLIGAGKMGGAMLAGWVRSGLAPRAGIVIDPAPAPEMAAFCKKARVVLNPAPGTIAPPAVMIVAVKPQMMDKVLPQIVPLAGPKSLILSVAAGKTIAAFASAFGPRQPIVRAMPNTPAAVGRGITVCCPNNRVTAAQKKLATRLLEAVGEVDWVGDEALIDAVTGVSGSGPAYVFHVIECMTSGGIAAGLPPDLARKLARATVAGAGELVRVTGEEADVLRRNVTSPNGTTQAALDVLMGDGAMAKLFRDAISAATRRSRELAG